MTDEEAKSEAADRLALPLFEEFVKSEFGDDQTWIEDELLGLIPANFLGMDVQEIREFMARYRDFLRVRASQEQGEMR